MSGIRERLERALEPDYRIERVLESGGMGLVFVARDIALERTVAIKVIRPELATQRAVDRFLREARILAALQDPGIVAVHRAGEADGLPYYVMDYIEGPTLAARLAQGKLAAKDAVRLAQSLLDSLAVAHDAGVTHRDVKPANIFLTGQRVLLADFGIARDERRAAVSTTTHLAGTPAYMAPEQAVGGNVGPRADLYAVGMILYESLTGRRWPRTDRPDDADWEGVPAPLRPVLARALAWSPDARWPGAAAFRAAVERAWAQISEDDIAARAEPSGSRTGNRFRRWAAIGLLVLAAGGGGYFLSIYVPTGTPIAASLAVLPFTLDISDAEAREFSQGQAEALITAFRRTVQTRSLFESLGQSFRGDATQLINIGASLGVTHLVTIQAGRTDGGEGRQVTARLVTAGGAPLWQAVFPVPDLSAMYAMQDSIVTRTLRELDLPLTDAVPVRRLTENQEAWDAYQLGVVRRELRNPELLGQALADFSRAIEADTAFVEAWAAVADVYSLLGSFEYGIDEPQNAFLSARIAADRALELDSVPEALASRANIAMVWERDWSSAEQLFQRAIAKDPSYAPAHLWYALLLACREDFDLAEDQLDAARVYRPTDPLVLTNIARNYYFQGQYDQAERRFRAALLQDDSYALAHIGLGLNLAVQDSFAALSAAIAEYGAARRTLGDQPVIFALLSHAYARRGDRALADSMLQRLQEIDRMVYYVPREYFVLVHMGMEQYEDALAELEAVVDARSSGAILLGIDPILEPLRTDARFEDRFQALVDSVRIGSS